MTLLERLLSRFFRRFDISSGTASIYMRRWVLANKENFTVFLHRFTKSDPAPHRHDHPKWFLSVGLWGSYTEDTETGPVVWRAPWIRLFPPEHRHRVLLHQGPCWTLCITGPKIRHWGFWVDGRWIPWRTYLRTIWETEHAQIPLP